MASDSAAAVAATWRSWCAAPVWVWPSCQKFLPNNLAPPLDPTFDSSLAALMSIFLGVGSPASSMIARVACLSRAASTACGWQLAQAGVDWRTGPTGDIAQPDGC